jgi:dipeptidyl aminopeptidase/acylaminoacyl peptidase
MRLFVLMMLVVASPLSAQSPQVAGDPYPLTPPGVLRAQVSPDGRWVALAGAQYGTLSAAPLVSASGRLELGDVRQLSSAQGSGYGFVWTAEARLVARLSGEGAEPSRLVAFDPNGGASSVLAQAAHMPGVPATSGASVAYVGADEQGRLADGSTGSVPILEGSRIVLVTPQSTRTLWADPDGRPLLNLAVSPAGRLAFEVVGGGLISMDAGGGEVVAHGAGEQPAWSPDGQWLAFVRTSDDGHELLGSDLWIDAATGGQARVLAETPDRLELAPTWGPTSAALLYHELDRGRIEVLPLAIR